MSLVLNLISASLFPVEAFPFSRARLPVSVCMSGTLLLKHHLQLSCLKHKSKA